MEATCYILIIVAICINNVRRKHHKQLGFVLFVDSS